MGLLKCSTPQDHNTKAVDVYGNITNKWLPVSCSIYFQNYNKIVYICYHFSKFSSIFATSCDSPAGWYISSQKIRNIFFDSWWPEPDDQQPLWWLDYLNIFCFQHIRVKLHWGRDKWPPISWRHFQMHFLEWKCMNFDSDFTEVCSKWFN